MYCVFDTIVITSYHDSKEKPMKFYAAPLEGITGYIFRNAHHKFYPGIDKYFTPFLSPKIKRGMNTKEQKDIAPLNNRGIPLVPQILTNQSDGFLQVAQILGELGYREINFNLGCPSGTVVSKGRGSGFLKDHDALRRFFDEIMSGLDKKGMQSMKISVKTRLGISDPEEILPLMNIYNDYPFSELIIHARCLKDYYKGPVNREAFRKAAAVSRHPLCYNGDLFTPEDMDEFRKEFPQTDMVMMGRGLIADPQLCQLCRSQGGETKMRDYDRLFRFLEEISDRYAEAFSGEKHVLFKLKELWSYMHVLFPDQPKVWKKIKKANSLQEYNRAIMEIRPY